MEGLVVGPKLQVTDRYGKSSSLRHCHQLSQASGCLALALQEGIRRHSIQKRNGSRIIHGHSPFRGRRQHDSECSYNKCSYKSAGNLLQGENI
jgi:hypothetical protein